MQNLKQQMHVLKKYKQQLQQVVESTIDIHLKKERAVISKYVAENSPTRLAKYFSVKLKRKISDPIARKFKKST